MTYASGLLLRSSAVTAERVLARASCVPNAKRRGYGSVASGGLGGVNGAGISLMLTTAQNIDDPARRTRERGGTLESDPADIMGARVFRLRDPDGFRLVFSSPR